MQMSLCIAHVVNKEQMKYLGGAAMDHMVINFSIIQIVKFCNIVIWKH